MSSYFSIVYLNPPLSSSYLKLYFWDTKQKAWHHFAALRCVLKFQLPRFCNQRPLTCCWGGTRMHGGQSESLDSFLCVAHITLSHKVLLFPWPPRPLRGGGRMSPLGSGLISDCPQASAAPSPVGRGEAGAPHYQWVGVAFPAPHLFSTDIREAGGLAPPQWV